MMKRIVALLLSVLLVIGCSVVGVSAQSDKIHPDLEVLLQKKAPDDDVSVYITYAIAGKSVADMPSWPDKAAATAEYKEYRLAKQAELQAVVFDGLEVTILSTVADSSVIVNVKAKDIAVLASRDLVAYISYIDVAIEAEPENSDYFCLEQFSQKYRYRPEEYNCYEELYFHMNNAGETDWVLLHVVPLMENSAELYDIIGNRLLVHGAQYYPFITGYGVYNVGEDTFEAVNSNTVDKYDGLASAFDKVGEGRLLGDVDNDGEISVVDVTTVQRREAAMSEYPAEDLIEYDEFHHMVQYYSDFNRDGERDILDVTCMQRYLSKMTYPIG